LFLHSAFLLRLFLLSVRRLVHPAPIHHGVCLRILRFSWNMISSDKIFSAGPVRCPKLTDDGQIFLSKSSGMNLLSDPFGYCALTFDPILGTSSPSTLFSKNMSHLLIVSLFLFPADLKITQLRDFAMLHASDVRYGTIPRG
jgi:hypothetical protein